MTVSFSFLLTPLPILLPARVGISSRNWGGHNQQALYWEAFRVRTDFLSPVTLLTSGRTNCLLGWLSHPLLSATAENHTLRRELSRTMVAAVAGGGL